MRAHSEFEQVLERQSTATAATEGELTREGCCSSQRESLKAACLVFFSNIAH